MDNISKIQRLSVLLNRFFTALVIIVPLYYMIYWGFINELFYPLVTVNTDPTPLSTTPLSIELQLAGFLVSLLPLGAFLYTVMKVKKLFAFYIKGEIFSLEQVQIFKKIAIGLTLWVVFSIIYESVKSVIFSINNSEGSRVLSIGVDSNQVALLVLSVIILLIAKIMDEGRVIYEENKLTV